MNSIMSIPKWNKSKFEKYVRSLQNKGLKFGVEELGKSLENVGGVDYICTKYSIGDNLIYQEGVWQFVGIIDYINFGDHTVNVIGTVADIKVPDYYNTSPCKCDHCGKAKKGVMYLVYNMETSEFKQVSKSCLKAYTGLNYTLCNAAVNLKDELLKFTIDPEEVALGGFNSFGNYRGFYADRVKKLAYENIKAYGYRKNTEESSSGIIKSTKESVIDLYYTAADPLVTNEEIAAVDKWVDSLNTNYNEYYRNASMAYKEGYYEPKDLALVISLISCYFKDVVKKKRGLLWKK